MDFTLVIKALLALGVSFLIFWILVEVLTELLWRWTQRRNRR